MNALLRYGEATGFGQASYVDGRPRDNVGVVFFNKSKQYPLGPIFEKITKLSDLAADMFGIEVYTKKLESIQVARYLPGDHYGDHSDHDPSGSNLEYDRKLSFFCSLTANGQFTVDYEPLNVGMGDVIIFPSTLSHAAPPQEAGSRYSFVAWIPGPTWK